MKEYYFHLDSGRFVVIDYGDEFYIARTGSGLADGFSQFEIELKQIDGIEYVKLTKILSRYEKEMNNYYDDYLLVMNKFKKLKTLK